MTPRASIGEFEEMVLLALVRIGGRGGLANELVQELEEHAGREVSRGAMYTTLDRLVKKQMVSWRIDRHASHLSGTRRRRFMITAEGLSAVSERRRALLRLWDGIEGVLRSSG